MTLNIIAKTIAAIKAKPSRSSLPVKQIITFGIIIIGPNEIRIPAIDHLILDAPIAFAFEAKAKAVNTVSIIVINRNID